MQKEKRYATSKNRRLGAYNRAKAALIPHLLTLIERAIQEETMSDIDLVAKKSLKYKKLP